MRTTRISLTGRQIAFAAAALLTACDAAETPAVAPQPVEQPPQAEAPAAAAASYTYTGTCDGSAAARLADGRLIVGNDEDSILRVYPLTGGAPEAEFDLRNDLKLVSEKGEADIEAAAMAGGQIYWITSHGRNNDGAVEPDRHRFFATAAGSAGAGKPTAYRDDLLKDAKIALVDSVKASAGKPEEGGWNIEALAPGPSGSLLLGFRSPLTEGLAGSAIIVPLTNPAEYLAKGTPVFGPSIPLDLGGRGVRDLLKVTKGYLLIAGKVGKESRLTCTIGTGRGAPRRRASWRSTCPA